MFESCFLGQDTRRMKHTSQQSRRTFMKKSFMGLGSMAWWHLAMQGEGLSTSRLQASHPPFHHRPRAKRVIFLFQSGGPSQLDLWDHKPHLKTHAGQELPDSIRNGQRLTGMTAGQDQFPVTPSKFDFHQHGQSGQFISEALPHMARIADDLCVVRSMHTEAINHDPAITFFKQVFKLPDDPAWVHGFRMEWGAKTINFQALWSWYPIAEASHCIIDFGERVPAIPSSGGQIPIQGRSGAVFIRPQRLDQRSQAADFGRSHGLEHGILRTNWRSRDSDAHGPI